MDNIKLTYTIVLVGYLLFMLIIGYITSKKITSEESFFVADKSLGFIVSLGTFAATFVSSSSIIGYVGWLYSVGWSGMWAIGGTLLSVIIGSLFLMGKLREYGENTIPDLFAARYYDKKIKIIPIVLILLMYIVFITVQVMGAGKVLNGLLGINYNVAVIITAAVFVFYTMSGGMYAVAWTDLFQAIMGFGFVIASIFVALNKVGGFTQMNIKLAQIDPSLVSPITGSVSTAVIFIMWNHLVWGTGNISQPAVIVRALSAKDVKTAKISTAWSGIVFVLFYFALMILAGTSKVLFPNLKDVDLAFPVLVQNLFHPIIGGLLISSIIAIIMSTADSVLLVVGSTISKDLYKDFIKPHASVGEIVKISRVAIMGVGILSALFALTKPAPILSLQIFNYSTIGAAFFIPMMVGFYWKRATREGAMASMVGGALANLLWYWLKKPWGLDPIIPGLAVGLVLIYVVSMLSPAPPEHITEKFFSKASEVLK
jgi:SSS family transporter